jgi:hypothetical protein
MASKRARFVDPTGLCPSEQFLAAANPRKSGTFLAPYKEAVQMRRNLDCVVRDAAASEPVCAHFPHSIGNNWVICAMRPDGALQTGGFRPFSAARQDCSPLSSKWGSDPAELGSAATNLDTQNLPNHGYRAAWRHRSPGSLYPDENGTPHDAPSEHKQRHRCDRSSWPTGARPTFFLTTNAWLHRHDRPPPTDLKYAWLAPNRLPEHPLPGGSRTKLEFTFVGHRRAARYRIAVDLYFSST